MNKAAMYEEYIYKEASRAWKRELGNLSELSRRQLTNAGVLDYKKELIGLKEGTKEIAKKHNIKTYTGRLPFGVAAYKAEKPKADILAREKFSGNTVRDKVNRTVSSNAHAITKANKLARGGARANVTHNIAFSPTHDKRKSKFSNAVFKKETGREMSLVEKMKDRRWRNAVSMRHEVDENRVYQSIEKKLAKKKNGMMINDFQTDGVIGSSKHISPKVVSLESANVAAAPKHIRNYYSTVRTRDGEIMDPKRLKDKWVKERFNENYKGISHEDFGLNYGASGVYNKSQANKAERDFSKSNFEKRNPPALKKKTPKIENYSDPKSYLNNLFSFGK